MKKVLILAYDFPPYVSVGGLRPYSWYKYLKEFGIHPVIVTRQWENKYGNALDYIAPSASNKTIIEETDFGTIIRTPYKPNLSNRLLLKYGESKFTLLRKMISAYYEFAQYFYTTGYTKELYKNAYNYLKENKVEVIIATGSPFVLFSVASKLSRKYTIPWIADYRDLWSQYGDIEKKPFLRTFYRFFEKRIMHNVSQIITVSEFLEHKIRSLGINKPFHILTNGYDHELISQVANITPNSNCLNIAFVGTIYDWHPWKSFISKYCKFILQHQEVSIKMNFYGVNTEAQIKNFILENYPTTMTYFSFTPRLLNREVLEKLAQNHVMLLFNYYSYMGTKIFDYLGIKRKMILCYSDDTEAKKLKEKYYKIEEIEGISKTLQADLLHQTNSGIVVKDANHLETVLLDFWQEFETTKKIECDSVGIEKYSRREQVEKLARIIQEN